MLRHADRALNVGSVQERQDALADTTGVRSARRFAGGTGERADEDAGEDAGESVFSDWQLMSVYVL
ncbi:hypothetical protein [Streptomyces sp. NPDC058695]|uniref:hypothetical protein n=1 Tax=Streptomyces sp. NPDC058695 TaxID=3346604 RepID=UPI003646EE26